MIFAGALSARLAPLAAIGNNGYGTTRLAWTEEDRRAARWFAEQAADVGLAVERDPAGNLWACPDTPAPWWAVGSHLDSVRSGGRYDGALGVAAAFEVAAKASAPVAVVSFADEEGARFNTPTFGSKALVGRLEINHVLDRRDEHGASLRSALVGAGVDPDGLADAPQWLDRLRGFLELHIDQSRDVARAGRPAGIVSALASRMRVQVWLRGEADHAGTTPRSERRDALAAAARLIVAADELAAGQPDFVVTTSRLIVEPNALTTVPGLVRLWIDARAPLPDAVDEWRSALETLAEQLAASSGVRIELLTQSRSPGVVFDADVRAALARSASTTLGHEPPQVVCFAGHDAGLIAEQRPAGMVLVRNERGISHAPTEEVDLDDAAAAATIILGAIDELAAS